MFNGNLTDQPGPIVDEVYVPCLFKRRAAHASQRDGGGLLGGGPRHRIRHQLSDALRLFVYRGVHGG